MNEKILIHTEEKLVKETTVSVPVNHTQVYKDLHPYILLVSPGTPAEMILWLITQIDEQGQVSIGDDTLQKYNGHLPTPITERSFYRVVKILVNKGLLVKLSRGEYKVNPKIIYGQLGISLEMPTPNFVSNLLERDKVDMNADSLLYDFQVTSEIDDTPKTPRKNPLVFFEEVGDFMPDTSTHTEEMTIEEAKEIYPELADVIDLVVEQQPQEEKIVEENKQVIIPPIEKKEEPAKLNFYGRTGFKV